MFWYSLEVLGKVLLMYPQQLFLWRNKPQIRKNSILLIEKCILSRAMLRKYSLMTASAMDRNQQ